MAKNKTKRKRPDAEDSQGDDTSDVSMESEWEEYVKDPARIGGLDLNDCSELMRYCISKIEALAKTTGKKYVETMSFIASNIGNQASTRDVINGLKAEWESKQRQQPLPQPTQQQQQRPTYSSILARGMTQPSPAARPQEDTVIIKPKEGISPVMLETKVKSMIRASTSNHRISYVKATRNVVIVKVPKKDKKANQLIEEINNNSETKVVGNAYSAKPKDPTVVLWGVASDTPIESIPEQICRKNEALDGLKKEIKYMFKVRGRNRAGEMNLALRVSPKVYSIMTDPKGMANWVLLDTQLLPIEHRIFISQCQKCYQYQHKTADCPNKTTCRDCGKEKEKDHQCTGPMCCINCKKSDRPNVSTDHLPNTTSCPIYCSRVRREDEETDYGPKHNTHTFSQ